MKKLKNVFLVLSVFLVSAFFISSCNEPIVVPPHEISFYFYPYEYSDEHFFFDTLYKASFLDYYNNTTGVLNGLTVQNTILKNDSMNTTFEVWIQTDVTDTSARYCAAYTMLYGKPPEGYPDTLKSSSQVEGIKFSGWFRKMYSYEYYMNYVPGFIFFTWGVPDNYHIGVTYKTNSGVSYGTPGNSAASNDTLILKMIKCANQSPDATPLAWELKMKNIYVMPYIVPADGFDLDVKYSPSGGSDFNTHLPNYSNKSISTMLDIDRYTGMTRNPPPDGKFDMLNGYTINRSTRELIFPTLRPFYDNFAREGVSSAYWYREIYTQRKSEANNAENTYKYRIVGKFIDKTPY